MLLAHQPSNQKVTYLLSCVCISLGIRDLKLKRIVSVWQAFALQKTALLIEHKEDPYLSLPSNFKKKLEPDLQDSCKKRLGLGDKCNKFMLTLNEILLHLNYEPYRNFRSDWRLVLHFVQTFGRIILQRLAHKRGKELFHLS